MTASYPGSVKTWSPTDTAFRYPEDLTTIVYARHVTQIYDEVTAIENELGAGGVKTSVVSDPGSYTPIDANAWGSLKLRLNNIEQGVITGVENRVSTAGGSSISSSSTTVGLVIKTSGTGNLLEIKDTSNVLAQRFDKDGVFYGVIDGGTA